MRSTAVPERTIEDAVPKLNWTANNKKKLNEQPRQTIKSMELFNTWANMTGFLLSHGPSVLDTVGAAMFACECRNEQKR